MTGLNNDFDVPNRSNPWEARADVAPGAAGYAHARQESAASDTAMFENPFNDPSREEIPAEHLGKPIHNQYDEYRDPYYRGAQGAL
jgi:hypothetical protein